MVIFSHKIPYLNYKMYDEKWLFLILFGGLFQPEPEFAYTSAHINYSSFSDEVPATGDKDTKLDLSDEEALANLEDEEGEKRELDI